MRKRAAAAPIDGDIRIERAPAPRPQGSGQQGYRRQSGEFAQNRESSANAYNPRYERSDSAASTSTAFHSEPSARPGRDRMQSMRIYPYGVARNRLSQAARRLGVPAIIVDEPGQADALVTLRSYYRKRMQTIMEAETRNIPIYVLRSNTVNQMQQFLGDLFNLYADDLSNAGLDSVLEETRQAIHTVMNGERWVELHPAISSIRRMQHQMAREANLVSHSYGKEPNRRVRIFRET
jgi:glycerophosphoryl diester phosphodiesterase